MDTYTDTRGERTVGGFVFQTTEDAALASQELKKTEYLKTVQVDFEGLKVNAPGCWDKYLTNLYGDYMRLPPEEQRLTHDMEIWLIK